MDGQLTKLFLEEIELQYNRNFTEQFKKSVICDISPNRRPNADVRSRRWKLVFNKVNRRNVTKRDLFKHGSIVPSIF